MNTVPESAVASEYPAVPPNVTVCPGCRTVPDVGARLVTPLIESVTVGVDGVGAAGDELPQPPAMSETSEMARVARAARKVIICPPIAGVLNGANCSIG